MTSRTLALWLAALTITLGLAPAPSLQNAPRATNARAGALIDFTGQWVSVVTEDWRWRMVTPPKGDTASIPLNPAGRKVADAWDVAADRVRGDLCKAFGDERSPLVADRVVALVGGGRTVAVVRTALFAS